MALAKSQMIDTMNLAVNMQPYYQRGIPGGSYNDTVNLTDTELPDNTSGLRNGFAQQLLHEQMIESQYD